MGIERFFSSIEDNNITNLNKSFTNKLESPINCKQFYIDFNSIIHVSSYHVLSAVNYVLYQIISGNTNSDKVKNICSNFNIKLSNTAKEFSDKFTVEKLDEIIINTVIINVISIIESYINTNVIEDIYIAIDGVPTKSKIMEQKKRRYMGAIMASIRNKLFIKHKNDLKSDIYRFKYETLKIMWTKNSISPGTLFMERINKELKSKEFKKKIFNMCKNLKSYECSGYDIYGEGEKKIVNKLMKNKRDSCVIYSPDSDVTLLALLLNNNGINDLKLLRHNQQKGNHDIVDIDILGENIYNYIKSKIKFTINKYNIIDDIVFALTVFGNDFLPKIESFNVKYDFNLIIDRYINVLNQTKKYIIIKKGNIKIIDQKNFINFIKLIQIDEGGNLKKAYISSNYNNYNKLKRILNATYENFIEKMTYILDNIREINKDIKNKTYNEFYEKWVKKDELINILKQLTHFKENVLKNYYEFYKKNKSYPLIKVNLYPYTKKSSNTFHSENINNSVKYLGENVKVHEYDKEVYRFENMLDDYQIKFNAYSLDLGKISIDKSRYVWVTEKIETSVKNYYKEFFDINNLDIQNKKLSLLIKKYIEGWVWVFNHYYNSFDEKFDTNYSDVWYYPYNRAPLLTQVYKYLREHKNKTILFIKNTKISKKKYFNEIEHLLYVSPANTILDVIPQKYHKYVNKIKYPNIDNIANKIINGDTNIIDCKGIIYLNKCHVEGLFEIDDNKIINLVKNN